MRVAIIGTGVVGRAQARMFREHDVVTWDITDSAAYPHDAVSGCDFAVICAGTPALEDGSADLSAVKDAVSSVPPMVPVLIRSTVPPGTTDEIASQRSGLVAHAPEFLHEREGGPWRDSTDVPFMILGGDLEARLFFRPLLAQVFPGTIAYGSALEAELVKYTANLYWATKVTFVSEMAAVCEAFGADWAKVRCAWLADERVAPAYTCMAGYEPGFGGRCWPKDLSALIEASFTAGYTPFFLMDVQRANARFRDDMGA